MKKLLVSLSEEIQQELQEKIENKFEHIHSGLKS